MDHPKEEEEEPKGKTDGEAVSISKLDLSKQCLKKIPKNVPLETSSSVTDLHLDDNEIDKLDGIELFPSVVELSASRNQLVRMGLLSRLRHIVRLDLSYNNLVSIEGLKEMVHLKYFNASRNKIKAFDRLSNPLLEHLDLSENLISSLSNIKQLNKLQKLYLSKNLIKSLEKAGDYLPGSLVVLTLAGNKIEDLNEVSYLSTLSNLKEVSIGANPCIEMTSSSLGFDYRPFVANWCVGVKVIDGFAVDDIEVLKAEWLYSQGKGRYYRPGQHVELVKYLVESCPLTSTRQFQTEQERKLRLILSKAIHHQRQLQSEEPGGKGRDLMTRSLDPSLLECSELISDTHSQESSLTRSLHCEPVSRVIPQIPEKPKAAETAPAPLPAATKLLPVPESLISPMLTIPPNFGARNTDPVKLNKRPQEPPRDSKSSEVIASSKLQTIKVLAEEKRVKKTDPNDKTEKAAICIQRIWRGYQARNSNPKVLSVYQRIQMHRTNRYIAKLSQDMEATRAALVNEHKLQLLQIQALNALWRKVASLQLLDYQVPSDLANVRELAQTCDRLSSQVTQLQQCMQGVLRCVSPSGKGLDSSTQTEITAVHTPIEEPPAPKFIYNRPSSLLLPAPVSQYAEDLVDGGFRDTVTAPPPAYQDNTPCEVPNNENQEETLVPETAEDN